MVPQITSFHQVEDQVESISILKGEMHVDNKGGGELGEQHSLVHDTLDTFLCHHAELFIFYIDFSIYFIAY